MKVSRKTQLTRYYLFPHVKIHHIHGEDKWHTHPWNGFSIIFGSYEEDIGNGYRRIWFFNKIGARRRHRVRGNVWTIFIHFQRINEQWEWDGVVAPFRGPDKDNIVIPPARTTNRSAPTLSDADSDAR